MLRASRTLELKQQFVSAIYFIALLWCLQGKKEKKKLYRDNISQFKLMHFQYFSP